MTLLLATIIALLRHSIGQKGRPLLYMLHCICHVRFQPKAAFPLRNRCRNPPGKVLASDALAMFIVRHLVSGDSIPNPVNERFGYLFGNFAACVGVLGGKKGQLRSPTSASTDAEGITSRWMRQVPTWPLPRCQGRTARRCRAASSCAKPG